MAAITIAITAEVVAACAMVANSLASMISVQPFTTTVTVSVAGVA